MKQIDLRYCLPVNFHPAFMTICWRYESEDGITPHVVHHRETNIEDQNHANLWSGDFQDWYVGERMVDAYFAATDKVRYVMEATGWVEVEVVEDEDGDCTYRPVTEEPSSPWHLANA